MKKRLRAVFWPLFSCLGFCQNYPAHDPLRYLVEQNLTVTCNANDPSATGTPPTDSNFYASGQEVTVPDSGDLQHPGYYFGGWNTAADGSGTTYKSGGTFTIHGNTGLYAVWSNLFYIYISKETSPVLFDPAVTEYASTAPYEIGHGDLAVAFSLGQVSYRLGTDDQTAATLLAALEYANAPLT